MGTPSQVTVTSSFVKVHDGRAIEGHSQERALEAMTSYHTVPGMVWTSKGGGKADMPLQLDTDLTTLSGDFPSPVIGLGGGSFVFEGPKRLSVCTGLHM
eukprot:scaffold1423_cov39-Attheya_sp.AAC.4